MDVQHLRAKQLPDCVFKDSRRPQHKKKTTKKEKEAKLEEKEERELKEAEEKAAMLKAKGLKRKQLKEAAASIEKGGEGDESTECAKKVKVEEEKIEFSKAGNDDEDKLPVLCLMSGDEVKGEEVKKVEEDDRSSVETAVDFAAAVKEERAKPATKLEPIV